MKIRSVAFLLVLSLILSILAGCGDSAKKSSTYKPEVKVKKGLKINADCVVKLYQQDSGKYVTAQNHIIFPGHRSIEITAEEPSGEMKVTLEKGKFSANSAAPGQMSDKNVVEAILTSVAASLDLVGQKEIQYQDTIKIEGQWYKPVIISEAADKTSAITVYENTDTERFDLVHITTSDKKTYVARAYNWKWYGQIGRNVPAKVDVFKADQSGYSLNRAVTIEYHQINFK